MHYANFGQDMKRSLHITCMLLSLLLLPACAQTELASHVLKEAMEGGKSNTPPEVKVGNPYKVLGRWYRPKYDPHYSETGIASWYGPGFHGKMTANGETFNQNDITAAHKTLPLPSMVRVTNLENGRALVVRLNDRGPFKDGRIIDLSKRSAELLGVKGRGTAKVRVDYLEDETRTLWAQSGYTHPDLIEVAATQSDQEIRNASLSEADTQKDLTIPPILGSGLIERHAPVTPVETRNLASPGTTQMAEKPNSTPLAVERVIPSSMPSAHVAANQLPTLDVTRATPDPYSGPRPLIRTETPAIASTSGEWISTSSSPNYRSPVNARELAALEPAAPSNRGNAMHLQPQPMPPSSYRQQPTYTRTAETDGRSYIQAGAFSERQNATKAALRLASHGSPMIEAVERNGQTLYRVRLGPYSHQAANQLLYTVQASGFNNARVVDD